jgi:hypothetical protein
MRILISRNARFPSCPADADSRIRKVSRGAGDPSAPSASPRETSFGVRSVPALMLAAVTSQACTTVSIADAADPPCVPRISLRLHLPRVCREDGHSRGRSMRAARSFSRLRRRCRAPGFHGIAHQVDVGAGPGAPPAGMRATEAAEKSDSWRARCADRAQGRFQMHMAVKVSFTITAILTVVQACDVTTACLCERTASCRSGDPLAAANPRNSFRRTRPVQSRHECSICGQIPCGAARGTRISHLRGPFALARAGCGR